ncbi:MAG: hypothetical protein PVH29_00315 [Candidatus Zixiibacteriota bacterium]
MKRYLAFALAGAALLLTACYEPDPPEEASPRWYWHNGPTVADLYDVSSTARSDVWTVGENISGGPEVMHFTAFRWEVATLPEVDLGPLYAVSAEPSGDVWAAGGGDYFLRWDGTQWRTWPHPSPGDDIYGLAMVDEMSGWAVGERGLIFQFDGLDWNAVASPTAATLRRVRVLSATSAWAVGDDGTVLHYDGSDWNEAGFAPTMDLYDLKFFSDDDGWVVGDLAAIYHWNGTAFQKYDSPFSSITYLSCGFAGSSLGWAGGNELHVGRYEDDEWTVQPYMPSGQWQLNAIHMVSTTEGWAVGPDGAMMHYYQ